MIYLFINFFLLVYLFNLMIKSYQNLKVKHNLALYKLPKLYFI